MQVISNAIFMVSCKVAFPMGVWLALPDLEVMFCELNCILWEYILFIQLDYFWWIIFGMKTGLCLKIRVSFDSYFGHNLMIDMQHWGSLITLVQRALSNHNHLLIKLTPGGIAVQLITDVTYGFIRYGYVEKTGGSNHFNNSHNRT